jgi:hypothetical protein
VCQAHEAGASLGEMVLVWDAIHARKRQQRCNILAQFTECQPASCCQHRLGIHMWLPTPKYGCTFQTLMVLAVRRLYLSSTASQVSARRPSVCCD